MKCEKCGSTMNLQEGVVYTTYPAMYGYTCPSCGNIQYSLNRELKETMNKQERLSEFSTKDLKNEIKRRVQVKKQKRESVPRCRNCQYCEKRQVRPYSTQFYCSKRTYKYKKLSVERNYMVMLSNKACDLYKRKTE